MCCGAQLNLTPGRKGLREALGHVPSWIQFSDREKVEVWSRAGALLSCGWTAL